MVNLPTGKMKSREGTVVDADDLFDEMVNLAKTACEERDGSLAKDIVAQRAEIIGMGALKFMLLKFNAKTTIMFDPAASIRFEGDTGPYVQYVCARINSIERKAMEKDSAILAAAPDWSLLGKKEEKKLAAILSMYGSVLKSAAAKKDCSPLVEYLLNVAKAFNKFYRECPVLTADTKELMQARLHLALACKTVLSDGLNTLTIQVPEAM
jgi:arginyl-tRNA synthetase